MSVEELIEKYTDEDSNFIEIDGLKVHYKDEGDRNAQPFVLIHGTFASLHAFDEWAKILKKQFRVIRMDLPGFGITGPNPNEKYSIEKYDEFIYKFIQELGVTSCYLAGNSLGGWLAWEFALQHQDCVDKLILIDAAGYINDKNLPLPFVIAQTPVLRNIFNFVPLAVVRRFVRQVFCNQSKVTDELVQRYFDLFHRDGNKEAFVKIANTYYVQNTHSLFQLKVPTLVLWGEKDNWLNVEQSEKFMEDLPNAKRIVYENVGHVPMEEIPEKSAEDVLNFLNN